MHKVDVCWLVILSNHLHLLLVDNHGLLGDFLRDLHRSLTRCINALRGRDTGSVWDPAAKPSVQRILDADAAISQAAYVCANPVRAGAVARASEWPGLHVDPEDIGTTRTIRRPDWLASHGFHDYPDSVELTYVEPELVTKVYGEGHFAEAVATEVARIEEEVAAKSATPPLGPEKCCETSWTRTAPDPPSKRRPGQCHPELICSDEDYLYVAISQLQEFRQRYDHALRRYRGGRRRTRFPAGTFAMRLRHGVVVAGLSPPVAAG